MAAITKDRYTDTTEAPSDFSATTLIAPIQQTILKRRYPDKLKIRDVVDDFWAFMGSIAHNVLEEAWHEEMGSKVEERLYMKVLDKSVSGKMDCYANGEIRDYKTCRAYKIVKGDYYEWEKQLNIYAQLCRANGWPVTSLKVIAIVYDWAEREVNKPEYPNCPFVIIPIRLWSEKEIKGYINHRVKSLISAESLSDAQLMQKYPCTDRDMWRDVKDVALLKGDAQRAYRTFQTEEEAAAFQKEMGKKGLDYDITIRYTERKRCAKWCDAANCCLQNKAMTIAEGGEWHGNEQSEGLIF